MKLEVFFDYTCPYCYLALHELNQILPNFPELTLAWRPCEINPKAESDLSLVGETREDNVQLESESDWDYTSGWLVELMPRIEKVGLCLKRPSQSGNYSSLAIQGLLCLEAQGADIRRYNDAVYAAVFCNGRDIANLDVLSDCAASAGGDVHAFRQALVSKTYKKRQLALNKYGWEENGLDAVPSFRLGDERLNAVYAAGVLPEQLIGFLEKHGVR